MTADAFSVILDFMYSGRLALNRSNVIEVMSAASYLQMTDLVNVCKEYISSSLEICSKDKERNAEKEAHSQEGEVVPADSGTSAGSVNDSAEAAELHSLAAEADKHRESTALARTPASIPVTTSPGTSRDMNSDSSSREEFKSVGEGQSQHMDQNNHASSSSSSELVNPKIEYEPDEELIESPYSKELTSYPGPSHGNPHHIRLQHSSPSPTDERSPLEFSSSFNSRHGMEMYGRGESLTSLEDRAAHRFNHEVGSSSGGSRLDDGLGFVGSSIMEIQTDWLGEDTGSEQNQKLNQIKLYLYSTWYIAQGA